MKNFIPFLLIKNNRSDGKQIPFFHSRLKAGLGCFFLFWCFLFSIQQAKAQQYTADFSSAPVISNPIGGSWPWNTLATITLGGVEYEISQGGNGSWEHTTTGGKTGGALKYVTAATTSVTIQRKDRQKFNFYGIWLKYTNFQDATYYRPPFLTITYSDSSLPQEVYQEPNQTVEASNNVTVTSVSLMFTGLNTLFLDNLIVGPVGASALPTVTTNSASSITSTSAILGGNITDEGDASVTERGIVYSSTNNPPTTSTKVTIGSGLGSFAQTINGLTASTTYYARAYATNSAGTAYGTVQTFTTVATTTTITAINRVSATPTNATAVSYTVTFSAPVTGVDASDFALTKTGTATGIISTPTGSGTTWIVPVTSVTGDGTLRLDFTGLTGVTPNVSAAYTSGQYYTLDNTAPTVTGVDNNGKYNTDKTITIEAGATATLNGASFTSSKEVSKEGDFTLIATDAVGNTTTLAFTIDKTAPVVSGVTHNSLYPANPTITFNEGSATLNGSAFTSGSTVSTDASYVLIVTDAAGNSTTINFTLDKTAPVISGVPTQAIAVATPNNSCETTITFPEITASDNLSSPGDITLKYTIAGNEVTTGNLFKVGSTEVEVLATDQAGNFKTAVFTVTVQDKTLPVITPPAAITQANDAGKCGAALTLTNPKSEDNCGIASIINDAPEFFPIGTTTVTWTVTDVHGNKSETTQQVTITDTEKPIAIAKSLTIQLSNSGTATITAAQVNNGSTDNCGIKGVELSKTAFSCQNIGPNTVTLTVTDNSGNIETAQATVTVVDELAPVAQGKNITIALINGTATITATDINNGSSDNCGIKSIATDKNNFTCTDLGANSVKLIVTDNAGNQAEATVTVTVKDTTPPTAIARNLTVQLDATGRAAITAAQVNNGSGDICGIKEMSLSKSSFDCSNVGSNTVILTVIDNSGNTATAQAIVTVEDKTLPTARTKDITVTLGSTGQASITATNINNGSQDNCGIKSMSVSQGSFNCSNIGVNTVTLTITDNSGNVSSATATVTVEGTIPTPAITVIPTSTVYTGGNPNIIYLGYGAQSVKLQASGGVKYTWSPASGLSKTNIADPVFTPTKAGTYPFTVTATNSSGCTATSNITITVIDARYGNKKNQVVICHNGKSNNIDVISVPDHLAHGDYLGSCSASVPAITSSRSYAPEAEIAVQPILKNYPNPFSGRTTIEFSLAQDEDYTLVIYDLKGTLVKQLPGGKAKAKELKQVEWQVGNAAAGLYIVRLTTATSVQQLKLKVE